MCSPDSLSSILSRFWSSHRTEALASCWQGPSLPGRRRMAAAREIHNKAWYVLKRERFWKDILSRQRDWYRAALLRLGETDNTVPHFNTHNFLKCYAAVSFAYLWNNKEWKRYQLHLALRWRKTKPHKILMWEMTILIPSGVLLEDVQKIFCENRNTKAEKLVNGRI